MRYLKKTFTADYGTNQSEAVAVAPKSNRSLIVCDIHISTEGSEEEGRKIKLTFGSRTICSFYTTPEPGVFELRNVSIRGLKDENLCLTSDIGKEQEYSLAVNYREV